MALDPRVIRRAVLHVRAGASYADDDAVAVERPLEIRVAGRPLAVTLRTPGDDRELTLGFLAGEGVIRRAADVAALDAHPADCADQPDVVEVALAPGVALDWTRLERHFAATSACGLCGRAHLESLRAGLEPLARGAAPLPVVRLLELGGRVHGAQAGFAATGGLHAAARFDDALELCDVREDVGRHNAVDKIAGALLVGGGYPAAGGALWVSGRAGAEIVLKAARARIPVLAAVGAPTSLSVELAEAARMTLIGFLRDGRMNIYCGAERIDAGM